MNELTFTAGVHSVGDREAVFYVMNTTVNRNKWTVSDKALEQALPTLIGKPLGCGPEYKTDRHYSDVMQVGVFTEVSKPDGYALGSASITDDTAWARLTSGEWGPVSVVVTSYLERCSVCGADLTGLTDPFTHQCIRDGGFLVVESFTFDHVDFIDVPAYPQAGLIGSEGVVPVELLAGVFTLSSRALEPAATCRESRSETMLEERLQALEASVETIKEQISSFEAALAAEPKNKHVAELGGLEAAMAEARTRLFGRGD
ncbi:MAG: hypothetical protein NWF07_12340 [Candidatus Bathyarchaeota archaeon]|nr:hypothetical protein [Candidatus Bathyarchaeota archaeon]